MAKVAVLIDLAFFLVQHRRRQSHKHPLDAQHAAKTIWATARAHIEDGDELYRILVYDCKPLTKKTHHPVTQRVIDFSRTEMCEFRCELHQKLVSMRKVALRLGELADRNRWIIRATPTRALLKRTLSLDELQEHDVVYDVEQKGVDIMIAIDAVSLAYKRLVDRIVLITGDSDFVPAAKLARREGLDVVLDPLWAPISPSLNEHIDGLRTYWRKPAKQEQRLREGGESATSRVQVAG
jgi:uncharacterized LabA/DUF88 family protein